MIPENRIGDFSIKYVDGTCYLYEGAWPWMYLTETEMASHPQYVDKCVGNVLISGLGLGYAAQLTAEKEDVASVTIVEKSPEVISLVWPHIEIEGKDVTTKIIQANIFDYVQTIEPEEFDWAYIDIWSDNNDHKLFYTDPLRKMLQGKIPQEKVIFWVE